MSGRRMIYPYTYTAKLAAFPFKLYYQKSPFFKFYVWSLFLSFPLIWKIQKLANSEASYVKLAEYRQKELEEIEEHKKHLI